ncbi:MAG: phosphodiester glycosidase family protein [Candidatus Izemoplasmatales bacterium]
MPVGPKRLLPYIAGFYALLFLFTTFTLLYEFVIPHGGIVITDPVFTTTITVPTTTADPITGPIGTGTTTEPVVTTTDPGLVYPGEVPAALLGGTVLGTYENENVLITLYQIRASNSDVYVADVVTTDGSQILAALAFNTFGGTNIVQTVSTMAEDHDAIFAINSDYASHYDYGYVIRNGMILRTSASYRDCVVLNADGTVAFHTEEETPLQSIVDDGAWQLWSFGPVIVRDGVSVASVNDGLARDAVNNPRSGFGAVSANHFMFVTVDGRTDASHGADIEEFADIMLLVGCTQAYNFDGGGSATMWFDGAVVNNPSEGTERKVGDCVYIRR